MIYETLLIAEPSIERKDVAKLVEKSEKTLEKAGGKLLSTTEWGKRKLAYEIKKHTEGYYILFELDGDKDIPKKFNDTLRLERQVLRFMTTKKPT